MNSPNRSSKMSDMEEAKSGPKPCAPRPAAVEGGVAELVVGGALLRVAQRLVGLVQLLELVLGGLVAAVAVGMAVLGEPAERRLDVLLARPPGEPQYLVVVALGHEPDIPISFATPRAGPRARGHKTEPSPRRNLDDALGCWQAEGWHCVLPQSSRSGRLLLVVLHFLEVGIDDVVAEPPLLLLAARAGARLAGAAAGCWPP